MIPVAEPFLAAEDIARATDALTSGWISSTGKYLEEFERSWAAYCQQRHGICVANGSLALDIALRLLDLEPGDEVILPTFTIITCAQPIVAHGGVPVVVDNEPNSWQMDVAAIECKITKRTKAIMVVHIYGHPVDMDPVLALCQRYGLKLIEDAAEAHGALYKGRPCGSFGDVVTFSFYANKLITTGEGGMILCNDDVFAARARSYRNLCFLPARRFLHDELGQNYRMTNVQAALGVGQVSRIEQIVEKKRHIAHRYQELLGGCGVISLQKEQADCRHVYWVFGILLDEQCGADCLPITKELFERGVDTRPFFLGMHEQPVFLGMGLFAGERYPVAEALAKRGFYIPSGIGISDEHIQTVAETVRSVLGKYE